MQFDKEMLEVSAVLVDRKMMGWSGVGWPLSKYYYCYSSGHDRVSRTVVSLLLLSLLTSC